MAVSEGDVDTLVLQLYRSAREVPFTRFQEHALEIIKPIMDFDTAIWGVGTSNGRGGFINSVHLHGLPPHMMDDYAGEVQSQDVAAERTSVQPGRTVSIPWDDPEMLTERRAVARAYLRKYRLTHLLCTALPEAALGLSHFLTVCRCDPARPWTENSRLFKERLFPHLIEAYVQARCLCLERHGGAERGHAIADRSLQLVNLTPAFRQLMLREWPDWLEWRLPSEVCAAWPDESDACHPAYYRGRHIIIDLEPDQRIVHVTARPRNMLDVLTAKELAVARCFARGLANKDVAREMAVSPHTVRNQIKSIYIKLGVNSKVALAACLRNLA